MNLDFFIDLRLAQLFPWAACPWSSGPNRHPKDTNVEDTALETVLIFFVASCRDGVGGVFGRKIEHNVGY
jgi:hypothetical protein